MGTNSAYSPGLGGEGLARGSGIGVWQQVFETSGHPESKGAGGGVITEALFSLELRGRLESPQTTIAPSACCSSKVNTYERNLTWLWFGHSTLGW